MEKILLGGLVNVQSGIVDGADLFLDRKSGEPIKPIDLAGTNVLSITVTKRDELLPAYLYYVMEYMFSQGYWVANPVTVYRVANIEMVRM